MTPVTVMKQTKAPSKKYILVLCETDENKINTIIAMVFELS